MVKILTITCSSALKQQTPHSHSPHPLMTFDPPPTFAPLEGEGDVGPDGGRLSMEDGGQKDLVPEGEEHEAAAAAARTHAHAPHRGEVLTGGRGGEGGDQVRWS